VEAERSSWPLRGIAEFEVWGGRQDGRSRFPTPVPMDEIACCPMSIGDLRIISAWIEFRIESCEYLGVPVLNHSTGRLP